MSQDEGDKEPKSGKDSPIEVTDRRSASRAREAPEAEPEERGEPAPDAGPEIDPELVKQLFPQNVYDVLSGMLLMLTELAWQKIGLRASPVSGEVERDFAQARVAIDTVSFIVDQMTPTLAPEQQRELKTLVANLQLNYARHIKEPSPGSPESG